MGSQRPSPKGDATSSRETPWWYKDKGKETSTTFNLYDTRHWQQTTHRIGLIGTGAWDIYMLEDFINYVPLNSSKACLLS